ncbi:hypothetical protein ABEX25_14495 [Paenibacillus thiaminolyticus]|uniref:hypothetical protein n=1 Tax=Paenibacillus thiaminolyticus TaxID=49283 RepID=UPI003D2BD8D8
MEAGSRRRGAESKADRTDLPVRPPRVVRMSGKEPELLLKQETLVFFIDYGKDFR